MQLEGRISKENGISCFRRTEIFVFREWRMSEKREKIIGFLISVIYKIDNPLLTANLDLLFSRLDNTPFI